MIIGKSWSL